MTTNTGMLGLTTNVGKREQAKSDINTMMGLVQMKEMEEQKEQKAELLYQEQLQKVQEQANVLLSNDRSKVNTKALNLQKEMQKKIRALGGTKKAFFKSGGLEDLANYRSSIINSEEFQTYKDNKTNMEKILMVQAKGMGHMINENDYKRLMAYNSSGEGKLTFTGLLNDVSVKTNQFEQGVEITPEQLLKVEGNMQKIIANWELDKGRDYETDPPLINSKGNELHEYIKEKGYGGIGTNQAMWYHKRRLEQEKNNQPKEDTYKSATGYLAQAIKGNPIAINQIDLKAEESHLKAYVGIEKDNTVWKKGWNWRDGLTNTDLLVDADRYQLKGGIRVYKDNAHQIAQNYYSGNKDKEGNIVFTAKDTQEMFNYAGYQDSNAEEGTFRADSVIMAWESRTHANEPVLLMNRVDKKGNILAEESNSLYGEDKITGKADRRSYMRFVDVNDENNVLYRPIPLENDDAKSRFKDALGSFDNLAPVQKEDRQLADELNQQQNETQRLALRQFVTEQADGEYYEDIDKNISQQVDKEIETLRKSDVNNSTLWNSTIHEYDVDDNSRSNLIRAWYYAASDGKEEQLENAISQDHEGGQSFKHTMNLLEFDTKLKDNKMTDEEIIKQYWQKAKTRTNDPQEEYKFTRKWFKYLYK